MGGEAASADRSRSEPLAHILRAALSEGALYIARADDKASARAEVGAAIERLLDGLRRRQRKRARTD